MTSRIRDELWLAGMSLAIFLLLLPFSSYIAAFQSIRESWNIGATAASALFSAYLVGSALSALLFLPQMDRLPAGRLVVIGLSVSVGTHLLFPLIAYGYWMAVLLRVLGGMGYIVAYMGGVQLVARRFQRQKRGRAVSLFVGAGYAGTTVSYVLSGYLLAQSGDWRQTYLLTAVLATASLPLTFALVWNQPGPQLSGASLSRRRFDLSLLRQPALVLIILVYALHTAELYLARLWLPQLLGVNLGLNGLPAALARARGVSLAGLMFMPGAVSVLVGGWLSDRLGRRRAAATILTISGACSLAIGWLAAVPTLIVTLLGFLYGLATAADSAIYSTVVTEIAPPSRLGSAQSLQSMIGFLVGAIVPVMAGSILDADPSLTGWGFAFTFNALLALLGLLALRRLRLAPLGTPGRLDARA